MNTLHISDWNSYGLYATWLSISLFKDFTYTADLPSLSGYLVSMNKTLLQTIKSLIETARASVVRQVDSTMTLTYFLIGRYIVEDEQQGEQRAGYAAETLKYLSAELTKAFGRGYSEDNLGNMRRFYVAYRHRIASIKETSISEKLSRKLESTTEKPFRLSWSHYVLLSRIQREEERDFYEIEAAQNNWGIKELQRQFNSSLYERLALSKDHNKVKELAAKGQMIEKPEDAIKSPYVLEFLGLKEEAAYSETDLEKAIINKLEHFMLELGKGFLFAGRQVRFTFDEEHYFVDLVFYNRLLQCFVLIDLKIGKLKHQDLGQMQMYVNYYDRFVKTEHENKTIGIIICKEKNDAMVEITLPQNNEQIFASRYQLYLPSKQELQQQVLEITVKNKK